MLHTSPGTVPAGGLPEPPVVGVAGTAGGGERAQWLAWDRAARLRRHTADELAVLGPYLQDATVRDYLQGVRQLLAQALAP